MQDNTIDQQLSELGPAPDNLRALVVQLLGERPLTLTYADELLGALIDVLPELPLPITTAHQARPLFDTPAAAAEVSALFESRPPPAMTPPAPFNARTVFVDGPAESMVFDPQPTSDPEATADAIVAAFDAAESEPAGPPTLALETTPPPTHGTRDTLEESPAEPAHELAPEADAAPKPRAEAAHFSRGSRRPDLDLLLNALDLESPRPPTEADAASTAEAADVVAVDGDDFEILVDDEILEIAEDDVELVDDDQRR